MLQRPTVAKVVCILFLGGESRLTANDKLFFLSVRELADYVGNYCDAPGLAATNTAQSAGVWWLRSPDSGIGYYTGTVYDDGEVVNSLVNHDWAARPAFNLNSDSILFTSAADGGKTDAAVNGNLTEVGHRQRGMELTLKEYKPQFQRFCEQHIGKGR